MKLYAVPFVSLSMNDLSSTEPKVKVIQATSKEAAQNKLIDEFDPDEELFIGWDFDEDCGSGTIIGEPIELNDY